MISTEDDLQRWFVQSGVPQPLDACIAPLPRSKASLGRWSDRQADDIVRTVSPHPDSYRLSLMFAPLEARIWSGRAPVWGGMIAAERFRICAPGEQGVWCRTSACDIVNLFLPVQLVDELGSQRDGTPDSTLAARPFVPDRVVFDLVHKMLDAQALAGPLARETCEGLVTVLVCYLLEHYTQPVARAPQGGLGGSRLRRVLQQLGQVSAEAVPNAELAAMCGMSEAHFSREFRRAVGLPPHQYLMKLRLERAARALLAADARVLDVAQEYGFANPSHFARAFAARFGMTPSEYRQTHALQ
jgi:AraC family transcriptional regulator